MNVEMMGVGFAKLAIAKTDYLVPHINDNDKEPSWDGDVEVYRKAGDTHAKSDLMLKVPVQIKGHKENNLRKQSIKYQIALSDLRNYLNAGGTTFMVVYVSEDGEKSQIYYVTLLPFELKRLINKYGHQDSKRIELKVLPKDKKEIADVFMFAATHIQRQRPAISCDPVSMEELIKTGQVTSFSFGYTRVPDEMEDPIDYLFDHDTYIYAKLPFGLELPVEHLTQIDTVFTTCAQAISVNGVQFFPEYTVEKRKDSFSVKLGKGIKFTTIPSEGKHGFTFTPAGTLSERIADEDFLIQAFEAGGFTVGETFCALNARQPDELASFKFEERKNRIRWFKNIKNLLDKLGVVGELDCEAIIDADHAMLEKLFRSVVCGQFVEWELNGDHFPEITIANLTIKLCAVQRDDNPNQCMLFSYLDNRVGYRVKYASGKISDISYHVLLKKDSMLSCCNIDFVELVKQVKSFPITDDGSGSLVWLLLEMLTAYDESGDTREDILNAAIEFATWLKDNDKFTPQDLLDINYCQAIARLQSLSENNIKTLHSIIESKPARKDVYVGTYLLLGDCASAQKHYDSMDDGERELFDSYPIGRFWK